MPSRRGDQKHFRFRKETGHFDHSPVWLAAVDTDLTWEVGVPFRVRLGLQEYSGLTSPTLPQSVDPQLQHRKNAGAWTDVTTTSSDVQAIGGQRVDGEDCGSHLLTGLTGTHWGNAGYADDGLAGTGDLRYGSHYECEFVIVLVEADLSGGDLLDLRVVDTGLIDKWTAVPQITAQVVGPLLGESTLRAAHDIARPTALAPIRGESRMKMRTPSRLVGIAPIMADAVLESSSSSRAFGLAPMSGESRIRSPAEGRVTAPGPLAGDASIRCIPDGTPSGLGALDGEIRLVSVDDGRTFTKTDVPETSVVVTLPGVAVGSPLSSPVHEVCVAGTSKICEMVGPSTALSLSGASVVHDLTGASHTVFLPGPSQAVDLPDAGAVTASLPGQTDTATLQTNRSVSVTTPDSTVKEVTV